MTNKLASIVYKLHDQRAKLAPSLELRKNFLEASYHQQIRSEKAMINSRIDKLQPGVRKVFLVQRLKKLNEAYYKH